MFIWLIKAFVLVVKRWKRYSWALSVLMERLFANHPHQFNVAHDRVIFDGKIVQKKAYEYVMLNKPAGYVTTREDRFAQKNRAGSFTNGLASFESGWPAG
jgi:16S rRNA U516 pseudouridylate synthase RsuA-like enzyme